MDPVTPLAFSRPPTMVDPGPPWPPRSVVEVLGNGEIPAELSSILADNSRTFREDGTALTEEKRSNRGIQSFLEQLASGVDPVPVMERVMVVVVEPDGRVNLMHFLFSVQVELYSTQRRMFACLGELPAKGIPPVVEIPNKAFVARRSVRAVPQMDHVTHIRGI